MTGAPQCGLRPSVAGSRYCWVDVVKPKAWKINHSTFKELKDQAYNTGLNSRITCSNCLLACR